MIFSEAKGDNTPEFTVSQINLSIKGVVQDTFSRVRVIGEITGFKRQSSGHLYFDLKDENAVINVVCWRWMADKIQFSPENGLKVVITGGISTYEKKSNFQLVAEKVELHGVGELLKILEERKQKLMKEGLFDESRKKQIPSLPERVGIITSPTGAVIDDIIATISAKFPLKILIYPSVMQGKDCPLSVISGLKHFNKHQNVDVIIIARGGGSMEDLFVFNDEEMVRAVAASTIPVISAIGHEPDITLIDFAADLRAPTPTGAARVVVKYDLLVLKELINDISFRLTSSFARNWHRNYDILRNCLKYLGSSAAILTRNLQNKITVLEASLKSFVSNKTLNKYIKLQRLESSLVCDTKFYEIHLASAMNLLARMPFTILQNKNGRMSLLDETVIQKYAMRSVADMENKLDSLIYRLDSLNPENVLKRGFAIIYDQDGRVASRVSDVGVSIKIQMQDGEITATKDTLF